MNCDFDLLSLYLEHGLTLPRRVRLEEHLRTCSTCRRELRELRRVDQVLSPWCALRSPVPASVENRVARSVRRRRRLKPLFALSRVMPAAVGTTAAALLVLVSVN
ncbi:MAG: zf-HC2 domain-containing protein, partial [Chloroflexota bacterium]